MRHHSRPGYGLFQLLILLAVLLILVGLLLTATQKVREAAARVQSANNLRQIGLAMHDFHAAQTKLPDGVDAKNFSALFHLLPYLEQENLFKAADTTKNCDDKANAKVRSTNVKIFMAPFESVDSPAGGTNYFAMAGSKMSLKDNDGVFFRDSARTFNQITDGLSNTVAYIEMARGDGGKKAVSVQRQHVRLKEADLKNLKDESGVKDFKNDKNIAANRGSAWIDGRFLQATMNATRGMNDKKPDVDCGGAGGLAGVRMFRNTSQILICDGSVRGITDQLTLATWQAAATASAGDVLGNDW